MVKVRRKYKPIRVNLERCEVSVGGKIVHMSRQEFFIIRALKETNRTLTRSQILNFIDGYHTAAGTEARIGPFDRTIDVAVANIRRKAGVPIIETAHCFGYKWVGK